MNKCVPSARPCQPLNPSVSMSYDYSKGFLERNQEIITELIRLAQSGEIRQFRSAEPNPLKNQRQIVSNLLASLAHNFPQYADIRQTIRTWITFDNGEWVLNVGRATHRALGRPPRGQTNVKWVIPTLIHQQQQAGPLYIHEELIRDLPTYERLIGRVLELPPHTHNVRAEFAQALETLEPFEAALPDWSPTADGPTTLVLTRRTDSTNQGTI